MAVLIRSRVVRSSSLLAWDDTSLDSSEMLEDMPGSPGTGPWPLESSGVFVSHMGTAFGVFVSRLWASSALALTKFASTLEDSTRAVIIFSSSFDNDDDGGGGDDEGVDDVWGGDDDEDFLDGEEGEEVEVPSSLSPHFSSPSFLLTSSLSSFVSSCASVVDPDDAPPF